MDIMLILWWTMFLHSSQTVKYFWSPSIIQDPGITETLRWISYLSKRILQGRKICVGQGFPWCSATQLGEVGSSFFFLSFALLCFALLFFFFFNNYSWSKLFSVSLGKSSQIPNQSNWSWTKNPKSSIHTCWQQQYSFHTCRWRPLWNFGWKADIRSWSWISKYTPLSPLLGRWAVHGSIYTLVTN